MDMDIRQCGSISTVKAPAAWFTGTAWQDLLVEAPEPARVRSVMVRFEPGARTHWHTHPLGQTLLVVAGCGRAQSWGGPIHDIKAGDVVWIPPGEKHWHGAGPRTSLTHIAIQEALNGSPVEWLEPVSDEQYDG
jgi:quercetin dioxygenase-like cupin family protein